MSRCNHRSFESCLRADECAQCLREKGSGSFDAMARDERDDPLARADRMAETRMMWWRESWLAKFGRWLSGDWWKLETIGGKRWGVWHPWRRHRWENYRFTLDEAKKEQRRLNSGREYRVCKDCGCTYPSHRKGQWGGVECP